MRKAEDKKLSEYEFVVRSIKKLRKPPYKGIHSVYSGFNQAFREYFGTDPVEATTRLAEEGKIGTRPVKGGVLLFLPEDAASSADSKSVLREILGKDQQKDHTPHKEVPEEEPEQELIILGPAEDEDS
jgi:hypothetical protein